ncbi:MAG: PEGA domain-containing protein [Deltaproteobacteria bacterium]|nr:PEGA domain-containing protein [Deltaproteobacteria bacterium]
MPTTRPLSPVLALVAALFASSAWAAPNPKTTAVNIDTDPQGAEVSVVEPAPAALLGLTPLKKVKVPQGAVKLLIKLAGHEDKTEIVTIGPKEMTLRIELVRKIVPATLDLAGDAASAGAEVVVDGEVKGKLPVKVQVAPGRHQIVVRKAGYVPWEKWTELKENQTASFDIALKAQEKPKGAILVSSTPANADVKINGAPKGKAPQLVENLEPGMYEVELVLDGHKPFKKNVTVGEGKRETVSGTLDPIAPPPEAAPAGPASAPAAPTAAPAPPAPGELTVLCDAPGGKISLDGEEKGAAPAKVAGLKPGEHLVECNAPGFPKASQTVAVKSGETKTVQLSPKAEVAATRGTLSVVCNVPNAKARLGDGEVKKTPCQFEGLQPGNHQVQVSADGYAAQTKTVAVEAHKTSEVKIELLAMGKIKVIVPAGKKGKVYIDGEIRGDTPLTVELSTGPHKVEVRTEGPDAAVESHDVRVEPGQVVTIDAKVIPPAAPKVVRRSNPTSAHVNDPGLGTIQVGIGLPAIAEVRISAGVLDGLQAGLEIRNAATILTEFELQGTYRLAGTKAFALAAMGGVGGGLGVNERNSFTVTTKAIASLLLGDASAFSIYGQYRFSSDKLDVNDSRSCGKTTTKPGERCSASQLPIGLQGEIMYSKTLNIWGKVEMDFAFPGGRPIYDQVFAFLNNQIRGGVGLTWLFN